MDRLRPANGFGVPFGDAGSAAVGATWSRRGWTKRGLRVEDSGGLVKNRNQLTANDNFEFAMAA